VTGGSRGIGAEIVRQLAADGADVAFTFRAGHAEAEAVAGEVRALGRCRAAPLYSGSKALLEQVTRVAARELAPRRITVNAVAPGTSTTGRLAGLTGERRAQLGASFALGRVGEPADTAAVVAFLVSARAGFITGQVVCNNGGQYDPAGRAG